jgi:hypothetical protein
MNTQIFILSGTTLPQRLHQGLGCKIDLQQIITSPDTEVNISKLKRKQFEKHRM